MTVDRVSHLSREERGLLYERLRRKKEQAGQGPLVIERRDRSLDPPPLSFAQQRLWFLDRLQPGDSAYNVSAGVSISGGLDLGALATALQAVVRRHDSLRTTFATQGQAPVQIVAPAQRAALPVVDLTALPREHRLPGSPELGRLQAEESRGSFDLAAGPLMRVLVVRLAPANHLLALTMHHIVSDGWSLGILIQELALCYSAARSGETPLLPELPIQYPDFAVWQRRWLDGEVLEKQLAYWRRQLAGAPPALGLPTDRPRPAMRGSAGASLGLRLDAQAGGRLKALARQEGGTPYIVLLAAFQALLHHWSGDEDICVGTVVANRNRTEVAGLIGFFVNTLVMRGDLAGDPTFRELTGRLLSVSLGAFAHQDLPFEKLVEELRPERDASRTPLFQVLLSLQNTPTPTLQLGGLRLEPLPAGIETAKFDLSLSFQEFPDEEVFAGSLGYATDLFEAATVRRLIEHFHILLGAALARPDLRLSELPLLSAVERAQLLWEWNDAAPEASSLPVLRRFEEWAARTPEADAVTAPGEALTFAELDRRAAELAAELRGQGVGPESRVGLLLGRSAGLLVGLLGVWKAGGAWVPLDPAHPEERLAFTLRDAGVAVLVTERGLLDRLPGEALPVVVLEDIAAGAPHPQPLSQPPAPTAGRGEPGASDAMSCLSPPLPGERGPGGEGPLAAYLLYTSGSTGQPKGAVIEQAALANYLAWVEGALGPRRLPAVTSLTFDASLKQLLAPLLSGRLVHIVAEETAADPAALLAELSAGGYEALNCVPSLWNAMLELVEKGESAAPRTLDRLFLGGQALPAGLLARTAAVLPQAEVWNLYGPTEATANAAAGPAAPGETVTVGRPVAGARAYVLDRRGRLVPPGVAGELFLGGPGLARGYLGRSALTAERFVPDPFASVPGGRLYRTGDLARRLADGRLELRGRTDHQVKVRGFRVELGEIEAQLALHPQVREAAVLARAAGPGAGGDLRLTACVVLRDAARAVGSPDLAAELRRWLRERLPEPMVPAGLVWLDRLPLTPTGKPDRRALASRSLEEAAREDFAAPRTPAEELLAGIWSEVLSAGGEAVRIGASDSFFDLGGHSLLATQVVSRVRETFGVDLPLAALFESPVLAALAARIEQEGEAGGGGAMEPLRPVPRDRPLPLSFAQERLWFLDRLQPGGAAYNMPVALTLRGELRPALLEAVLREVVRRHEPLRTTFTLAAGEPVQRIAPQAAAGLPLIDLSGLPEALREGETRRRISAEAARPFDLEAGPLLRGLLVRRGGQDHALLFDTHHIVSDGWSVGVLVREVTTLYGAALAGRPSPLPELPVQYADYAVWQRAWLSGEVLDRQTAYWRGRLAGAPVLDLPTDRPRPPAQSFRGHRAAFESAPGLGRELARLSREQGATLFMTLLAAFAVWLGRATGQEDLPLGTPIANRGRREIEGLIGCFVNTLVLRLDLTGDPTFAELLARTRRVALEAYAHQDLPFERLVEELRPERHLSHNPLFQVMVSLQNAPGGRIDLPGLELAPLGFELPVAKFDLAPAFVEADGRIAGAIDYASDLFDGATVQRLCGHLETLLAGVAADAGRRISELSLLTEAERHQLTEWTGAGDVADVAGALGTVELFEAWAERSPAAIAVLAGEESLSYGDLDRAAGRLAARLRAAGVGPGVPVGLCVERTLDLPVGILGIWKAGGAWVPLDPGQPAARLSFLLEDSAVPVVATLERLAGTLPPHGARTVFLDRQSEDAAGESEGAAEEEGARHRPPLPGDLAYVIYTSGTTGRPKGVLIEHGNLAAALAATRGLFGFGPADRMLSVAPFSFDIFLVELLAPLTSGAASVLLPLRPTLDLGQTVAALEKATLLHAVPALMRQVVDAARRVPGLARFAGVRHLFLGGDVVSEELFADLRSTFPASVLCVLYGPTEGTILCTAYRVPPPPAAAKSLLGRPLAGAVLNVWDRHGQPVPAGVPGEIWLGGAGVGRGYWHREDLNAEKFVTRGGERLFRTGDLARWLQDGNLEFLGRIDHQVKVRGFRIELGEIEAVLAHHPDVHEAVVVARQEPGGKRLVAYVAAERAGLVPELRRFVQAELPDYMVPSAFVVLPALPLTAHGKVDRAALPAPEAPAGDAAGGDGPPPRTATEGAVAEIWRDLLGAERPGIDANFFELGGHSLLAMQVVSRLRDRFQVEVPVRALFEAPTLAGLAERVDAEIGLPAARSDAPPMAPAPRGALLPLSFAQERMWFLYQLDPESPVYNLPVALRLIGELDAGALAATLREVVRRHEALRTAFPAESGRPFQAIDSDPGHPLCEVDLRGLPAAAREEETAVLTAGEQRRPFDLARGPLLRAVLVRLGAPAQASADGKKPSPAPGEGWGRPGEALAKLGEACGAAGEACEDASVLLLTLHHIVSDGWSMGVLVREVTEIYGALLRGGTHALPELPLQYADFAHWQRGWLQGEVLERELSYWRERLAGEAPLLRLPIDRPRPAVLTTRGGHRGFLVPAGLAARLAALARGEGATLFIVLLAGFQALLGRSTGQDDIWVGSPVAGRNRSEIEGLIGFFVNTLVLRGDLAGDPPLRELLARTRAAALGAFAHQDVPFEKLVEELRPERDPSRTPLFQAMFSLQNAPIPAASLGGLRLEPAGVASRSSRFDLTVSMTEVGELGIAGSIEHSSDLFDAATIDRLAGHFVRLLTAAVDDPGQPLSRLSLLGEPERHQVLLAWNDTATVPAADETLHGLFTAQAARTPEEPALLCGADSVTYRELADRAGRLGRHLQRLGVGPEVRVGVCLPRSPELVVSVLGVLLAGGAYVPMDPAYPGERLRLLLDDSGAAVLLTASGLAPDLVPRRGARVEIDTARPEILALPPGGLAGQAGPDNLGYVIYTSGSTGRPKGVLVPHRSAVNIVRQTAERLRLGPGERFLQFASLSFDGSVVEVFPTLASGACLCLIEHGTLPVGEHLAGALREMAVTVAVFPPSVLATLEGPEEEGFPHLHTLGVGAEKCPAEAVARWAPGRRFLNLYGPTEFTVYGTAWESAAGDRPGDPPVGRPVANASAHIVSRTGETVPIGVAGELLLGGAGLTRGYLGQPDRTAESFVPDPSAAGEGRGGERLYRTGDLGRWRPDGQIEVLGRIDQQVKVRGFRVELGEIEAVLCRLPEVRSAAVLAREDRPGDRRLVAYVVPREPRESLAEDLRAALARSLPPHMVPGFFVVLDEMPITANGKVDRRRLPAPERTGGEAAFVPPGTDTERELAAIWSAVLGLEKVGLTDNFFDLGGHSLLLTQVQARIREQLGRDLPLLQLIEHPTLATLAVHLGAGDAAAATREIPEDHRHRARRQRQGLELQRQRLGRRGNG